MAKSRKTPDIHVVFDTNCLFTEAADKLVSTELSEFILGESKTLGLRIDWYIPATVKAERKYQMLKRGIALLVPLKKMEDLLGHGLGIDQTTLDAKVDEAIRRQINLHSFKEIDIDVTRVDWRLLVENAVARRPPFDSGENEKGFRDSLVLESFLQLSETLGKSRATSRIILLTADQLLKGAAEGRTKNRENIEILQDLSALKTMLNAISSNLPQDAVNSLLSKAAKLFFQKGEPDSIYTREKVFDKISEKYYAKLYPIEEGVNTKSKQILIGGTTFISKEKQSVKFATKITVKSESTKLIYTDSDFGILARAGTGASSANLTDTTTTLPQGLGTTFSTYGSTVDLGSTGQGRSLFDLPTSSTLYLPRAARESKRDGEHIFEVAWSATLNRRGALVRPQLDGVEYKSSAWESFGLPRE